MVVLFAAPVTCNLPIVVQLSTKFITFPGTRKFIIVHKRIRQWILFLSKMNPDHTICSTSIIIIYKKTEAGGFNLIRNLPNYLGFLVCSRAKIKNDCDKASLVLDHSKYILLRNLQYGPHILIRPTNLICIRIPAKLLCNISIQTEVCTQLLYIFLCIHLFSFLSGDRQRTQQGNRDRNVIFQLGTKLLEQR
jgi:hypothetical protein